MPTISPAARYGPTRQRWVAQANAKDVIIKILVDSTGKGRSEIEKDIDRDFYMGPGQAKEYGLIDEIFEPKGKTKGGDNHADKHNATLPRSCPHRYASATRFAAAKPT